MILLTGGAGFIGSNLLAHLEERGIHDVIICDTLGKSNKWRNLSKRSFANIIPPEELFDFLDKNPRDIDAVFHLGNETDTLTSNADTIMKRNFTFGLELWNWAFRARARFIYLSTAAVYGNGKEGFSDSNDLKDMRKLKPLSLYGWSKHSFDMRVRRIVDSGASMKPPQWVGFRCFNVYGPNEYHKGKMKSAVTRAIENVARGKTVEFYKSVDPSIKDGDQKRDFVWVDDVCRALMWAYDYKDVNGLFNLGSGQARSFNEMSDIVFKALHAEPKTKFVNMPAVLEHQYQNYTCSDNTRLKEAGFKHEFLSLEDGVKEYVSTYLSGNDPYR